MLTGYLGTTATVQRETEMSLSSSSVMRTSQTMIFLPLCNGVPTAVTSPPSLLRMWLALISSPTASWLSRSMRL